jgi:hypothetical protein
VFFAFFAHLQKRVLFFEFSRIGSYTTVTLHDFSPKKSEVLVFLPKQKSGFFPGNLTPGPGLRQSSQVESFRRLKFLVFDAKSLDGTENPAAALRTVDLTSFLGI